MTTSAGLARDVADLDARRVNDRAQLAKQLRERAQSYAEDATAFRRGTVRADPMPPETAYDVIATELRRIAQELSPR
jgi:hypothetical protein